MAEALDYRALEVVEAGPAPWRPHGDEAIFKRLAGATILRIGAAISGGNAARIEGGGLIIDYRKDGDAHRVVFAFNENGMWAVFDSAITREQFSGISA